MTFTIYMVMPEVLLSVAAPLIKCSSAEVPRRPQPRRHEPRNTKIVGKWTVELVEFMLQKCRVRV